MNDTNRELFRELLSFLSGIPLDYSLSFLSLGVVALALVIVIKVLDK